MARPRYGLRESQLQGRDKRSQYMCYMGNIDTLISNSTIKHIDLPGVVLVAAAPLAPWLQQWLYNLSPPAAAQMYKV